MNSRQRVLAALNHQPVDRVPVDLGGTRQSGISVFAYARLREQLGLDPTALPRVFDTYQLLAEIEPEVLERFGSDTVPLNRRCVAFGVANDAWRTMRLRNLQVEVPRDFAPEDVNGDLVLKRGGAVIAQMPADGFYFDRCELYPGATHPDLSNWRAPRLDPSDLAHFDRESRRLADETDKAVIVALGPPYELFNGIGQGGFEDWMCTFATEDEYVEQLYRELVDAWIENLSALHKAVGNRVQVLQFCDDLGTQAAPFLSVEMFRDKLLPAYKRGLDWVHRNTDWKVLFHSDGAIAPLIPSLIEMGVDALNPVQSSCPGMEIAALKRDFGDKLAFWGTSVDPQHTLAVADATTVIDQALASLSDADSLNGGHVYASIHNIQADVAADNIVALFDAVQIFNHGRTHA
jgi:uroporphyrinogen decarboxylase